MPFKSEKQKAWMYKNKPDLAAKFAADTPKDMVLPKAVQKAGSTKPIKSIQDIRDIRKMKYGK